MKGRAKKTLVGVGRELRRLSTSDGVISKPHLLQILRTYHLGLTVEVTSKLSKCKCIKYLKAMLQCSFRTWTGYTSYLLPWR